MSELWSNEREFIEGYLERLDVFLLESGFINPERDRMLEAEEEVLTWVIDNLESARYDENGVEGPSGSDMLFVIFGLVGAVGAYGLMRSNDPGSDQFVEARELLVQFADRLRGLVSS